jgi:hypothetical protein
VVERKESLVLVCVCVCVCVCVNVLCVMEDLWAAAAAAPVSSAI